MSEPVRVYEHRCPYCHGLSSIGAANPGGWWETRCYRSQCRQWFHFGTYPPHTPSRISTVEIRCPSPDCGKKFAHGQFTDSCWLEVKCKSCNFYFHFGHTGRGLPATVSPYCVNSLSPHLRGSFIRALPLAHYPPPF